METGDCQWRNCDTRESRHHIVVECKAWAPQIRELWQRAAKDCMWKHPRVPAVRKLWREGASEAFLDFLRAQAGCWKGTGTRVPTEVRGKCMVSEAEKGDPGSP